MKFKNSYGGYFMKKKIYIITGAFIAIAAAVLMALETGRQREKLQLSQKLANEIIRFHVRANSDSDEDQQLKLSVRDAVISYLEPLLAGSESVEQSRGIIAGNEFGIRVTALNTIAKAGYDYDVNVYFENSRFPTKTYGDVTIPAGVYEAYRIDIGAAKGHNWWCVLYPPLCFEDATHAVMTEESKETLRQVLTEEEYEAITQKPASDADGASDKESSVKIRFRIFKFLNKYME